MAKRRVPAAEGLFTWPSEAPQLIGSHCKTCGVYTFPRSFIQHKPSCANRQTEEVSLSRTGKLWSYAVQHYPPPPPFKAPDPFVPYAMGAVELPEGLRILGMVAGADPATLKIGMDMELVVDTLDQDDENEYLTWKWRPAGKQAQAAKSARRVS